MQFSRSSAVSHLVNLALCVISLAVLIPFMLIVSISFSDERTMLLNGYQLWPEKFSLLAYELVFKVPADLLQAYFITISRTIIGTIAGLLLTALLGYILSRRDFKYQRPLTFYVFFTMLFNGGLVPSYVLISHYLHLKNTFWVLIVPGLLSPFLVMIMKGFLSKIPFELIESAKIDGSSELRIFARIILPLSKPALATIALIIAFYHWNDWWLGLLYIDSKNLVPLQLLLHRMMSTVEYLRSNAELINNIAVDISQLPNLSARMAMVVLAAGPMMFVFPFFQRHFVRGLTVGSLKE